MTSYSYPPRMKNLTAAQRRKKMRKVKVGDLITWGRRLVHCKVISVSMDGVIVDGGYKVAWDHNARNGTRHCEGGVGPIFLVNPKTKKEVEI